MQQRCDQAAQYKAGTLDEWGQNKLGIHLYLAAVDLSLLHHWEFPKGGEHLRKVVKSVMRLASDPEWWAGDRLFMRLIGGESISNQDVAAPILISLCLQSWAEHGEMKEMGND